MIAEAGSLIEIDAAFPHVPVAGGSACRFSNLTSVIKNITLCL